MALVEDITDPLTSVPTLASVGNNAHYGDSVIRHGNLAYQAGNYLKLPGTAGNYASVPSAPDLSFGDGSSDTAFSIAGWVRLDGLPFPVLSKIVEAVPLKGEWSLAVEGSGYLAMATYDGEINTRCKRTATVAMPISELIYVVGVYDGSGSDEAITLYINGEEVPSVGLGEDASYVAMTPNPLVYVTPGGLLVERVISTSYANGEIHSVELYPYELTSAQVVDLFAGGPPPGDPVLDIDFTNVPRNATGFTCETGQPVTINRSGNPYAIITAEQLVSDATQETLNSAPIYLPKASTGAYLHLPGLIGNTVSLPLTDGVYSAVITYADLTTANDSFTATGGVMTIGPTGANIANKQILRIELTGAEPANLNFLDQAHGVPGFKCSTGQTVSVNRSGADPATIIANSVIRYNGTESFMQALYNVQDTAGRIFFIVGTINVFAAGDRLLSQQNDTDANDNSTLKSYSVIFVDATNNALASYSTGGPTESPSADGSLTVGERFTDEIDIYITGGTSFYNGTETLVPSTKDHSQTLADRLNIACRQSGVGPTYGAFVGIDIEAIYEFEDPGTPELRAELRAGINSIHKTY